MWNAKYISYKGNTNFIRAYQGAELVWEKYDYSDAFWIENINDYPILFSVREHGLIRDKNGEYSGDVLFSFDKENWEGVNVIDYQGHITIPPHTKMYLINDTDIDFETYNGYLNNLFKIYAPDSDWGYSDTAKYNIGGNLNKLVYNWKENVINIKNTHAFYCLFIHSFVVDASELILPSNILTINCYSSMFGHCKHLKYPPKLPAKIVQQKSYYCMFQYCESLLKTSEMAAETIGSQGCERMYEFCKSLKNVEPLKIINIEFNGMCRMFINCTSLEIAPELPATNISGQGAYYGLFEGCTSLKVAPKLNHINWYWVEAFRNMFANCSSLEYPPELPTQHSDYLYDFCFAGMFHGCSNLKECAILPEGNYKCRLYAFYYMYADCVNITNPCEFPSGYSIDEQYNKCVFDSMFSGCVNLQTAPDLSWVNNVGRETFRYMFKNCTSLLTPPKMPDLDFTSTDDSICREMFYGCTSLTESPILYSSLIPNNGYRQMFAYCPNLSKITCLATEIVNIYSVMGMTLNVAQTGTFYKHPDMNDWSTGSYGIPSGWTVENYTE